MPHSFIVKVTDVLTERLENTAAEITSNGGSFEGDIESGTFKGTSFLGPIVGKYCRISEDEIKFTITDKPFIVPYNMIESEIKNYFA